MRRVKQLIGLPVVDVASGKRLALVRSLLIDPETSQLIALVLQKSSLLWDGKAVRVSQIHAIGEDAVLLMQGEEPVAISSITDVMPRVLSEDKLTGRQVLTKDGRMLGTLADLAFDPDNGHITRFILSDGLLQNLMGGYSTIPAPSQTIVGEETIIVPETVDLSAEITELELPQGR